jgi:hypothetical protein
VTWKIYSLTDPRDGRVRYVGKTGDIKKRLYLHISNALNSRKRNHRLNWIRSLVEVGQLPVLSILEEGTDDWQIAEKRWIKNFRDAGYDLVNATDGGEGAEGRQCSSVTREKMAAAQRGKHLSADTRAKLRAVNLGKRLSAEHLAKLRATNLGKHRSADTRAKLRAAHLGKHLSAEHRAKLSAAHRGNKLSAEHRAKIGAAGKGRPCTAETREKMRAAWAAKKASRCC